MRYLLFILLLLPLAVQANSLVLRSDDITIMRQSMPAVIEEVKPKTDDSAEMQPEEPAIEPLIFTVQIRSQEAIRLQGMHSLTRLRDDTGVMVLMTRPVDMPMVKIAVYTPVDVLMVNNEGTVVQIVPEIVLGRLETVIQADEPVKAFIYLKSGISVAQNIRPGDVVKHPSFTPAPTILK